jgi:perosamine synthetase
VIRVTDVQVSIESLALANYVLRTGKLAQGYYVEKLETLAALHSGTKHAVAVSSGTAALTVALMAAGAIDRRVAIPAFTFAGTANAVLAAGGEPVVVDVGDDRFIDPDLIPADVDFVMPVHLFGARMDTDRLSHPVVEDAAQAIGHTIGYGGISLYGSKTVGCGEGGLVVTNDDEIADWIRVFRNQGMRAKYQHVMPGLNLRLTDLQAAVALGALARLPEIYQAAHRQRRPTVGAAVRPAGDVAQPVRACVAPVRGRGGQPGRRRRLHGRTRRGDGGALPGGAVAARMARIRSGPGGRTDGDPGAVAAGA